ncbi:hypothetical protein OAL43_00995 [bacterium]|nr:hypothetical protein [bacterium]MDC0295416.1 hypothetical protein [bacterium]
MSETGEQKEKRDYVPAKNRRDAISKLVAAHPTLRAIYKPGPQNDGKAGWVNAIRDQHDPAYRLLFYLDRLVIAEDYRELDLHDLFFGPYDEHADPNYQRVLFTTTGGVNLLLQDLPDPTFGTALATDSLEVVPLSMDRDLRIKHLLEDRFEYICAFDETRNGMWILSLKDFLEIYVSRQKQEIQVRDEERIFVGDTRLMRPFLLRYVIKKADGRAVDSRSAANQMLNE